MTTTMTMTTMTMMTTMTTERGPRRRHAAAASRVLVGGISVASTLGLTAHWAAAAPTEAVAVEIAAPPAVAPAAQRIIIRRRIIRTEAAPAAAWWHAER